MAKANVNRQTLVEAIAALEAQRELGDRALSLEAVFAVLAGWLLLGEQLTARALLGCGLMLVGILISQVTNEGGE